MHSTAQDLYSVVVARLYAFYFIFFGMSFVRRFVGMWYNILNVIIIFSLIHSLTSSILIFFFLLHFYDGMQTSECIQRINFLYFCRSSKCNRINLWWMDRYKSQCRRLTFLFFFFIFFCTNSFYMDLRWKLKDDFGIFLSSQFRIPSW